VCALCVCSARDPSIHPSGAEKAPPGCLAYASFRLHAVSRLGTPGEGQTPIFPIWQMPLHLYIFAHSYTPNVGRESFGPPSFPSLAYRCTHTNEVVSTAFKEASQGPRLLRIDFGPSSAVEKSPVAVGFERSVTWEISIRWDPHPIMK
jgi:hypothetical protein